MPEISLKCGPISPDSWGKDVAGGRWRVPIHQRVVPMGDGQNIATIDLIRWTFTTSPNIEPRSRNTWRTSASMSWCAMTGRSFS